MIGRFQPLNTSVIKISLMVRVSDNYQALVTPCTIPIFHYKPTTTPL